MVGWRMVGRRESMCTPGWWATGEPVHPRMVGRREGLCTPGWWVEGRALHPRMVGGEREPVHPRKWSLLTTVSGIR